jgi:hypothetical protein
LTFYIPAERRPRIPDPQLKQADSLQELVRVGIQDFLQAFGLPIGVVLYPGRCFALPRAVFPCPFGAAEEEPLPEDQKIAGRSMHDGKSA